MSLIPQLIEQIKTFPDCQIAASNGLPHVHWQHQLPDDVRQFYELCGGMALFTEAIYPFTIMTPIAFQLANPVLLGQYFDAKAMATSQDDPSWSWYLIAQHAEDVYITIDLAPERSGRCYNSHWVLHPGNSYPIARSFTELLAIMLGAHGDDDFWNKPIDSLTI